MAQERIEPLAENAKTHVPLVFGQTINSVPKLRLANGHSYSGKGLGLR